MDNGQALRRQSTQERIMRTQRLLGCACGAVLLSLAAYAADWPQWRGPQRNGVSSETGLLKEWPKAGPRLVWQAKDIGDGYAAPSVVGNRIYILSNRGLDNEFVQALSTEDGKQVWSTTLGKVGNPNQMPSFPTARSTPTIDGGLLYALGSDGDLACLETASGKIRWRKSLRADFGGHPGQWAYSESPLVDGDALVVTPGGAQATIVALNKKTGETIWKSAVPGGDDAAYASVIVVEAGGRKQYVQFLAKGLVGVDAKTGQFLWRYDATGKGNTNIPSPVASCGYIYTSQSRGPGGLVRLTAAGQGVRRRAGLPRAGPAQQHRRFGGNWRHSLWHERRGAGGGRLGHRQGAVAGSQHRRRRDSPRGEPALYPRRERRGHPGGGDARSLSREGTLHAAGPAETYRAAMEKAWAYPVVANGRLYIRELDSLWCLRH